MEVLLQILLEPLIFAYFDLVESLFEGKQLKKGWEYFLKILCGAVSLIAFMLMIMGGFWMADNAPFDAYGTAMFIAGFSVLLVHVGIACFNLIRRRQKEKQKEKRATAELLEQTQPTPIVRSIEPKDEHIL